MAIATVHKGVWEGQFGRDPKTGAMVFTKWARGPESPAPPPPPPPAPARKPLSQAEQFERETGVVYPPRINKTLKDVGAKALENANPLSLQNLPYTIAGVLIPIGAMKLITMDTASLSGIIRLEWQIGRRARIVRGGGAANRQGGLSARRGARRLDRVVGSAIAELPGENRAQDRRSPRTRTSR